VPLGQLGKIVTRMGPPMIFDENGSLVGYVYIDLQDRDPGGYVSEAKEAVKRDLKLPPGYFMTWTGQYEHLERMQDRMKIVLPLTIVLIFGFLYFAMRSTAKTLITMFSIPLSAIGGIIFIWGLGYNTSVAVWVGIIALVGVAVQDTMVMIAYLDEAWKRRRESGRLNSRDDFLVATTDGAQRSLRSILMDVITDFIGLIPVMIATGLGADVMKRLSAPMFGGLVALMFLILVVIPVVYMSREQHLIEKRTTV
jgi:copper/silver efflux system protein